MRDSKLNEKGVAKKAERVETEKLEKRLSVGKEAMIASKHKRTLYPRS